MARTLNRLSPLQVQNLRGDGNYADGGNLYLQVKGDGRSWLFRYADRVTGKDHWLGLGPVHTITLKRARELAQHHREALLAGNDPLGNRRRDKAAEAARRARIITFAKCAHAYIAAHRASWKNVKHAEQWESTLATYCGPITDMAVADIETADVVRCLQPIWHTKTETASRLRGRIERVLGFAMVSGYRTGDNPAMWKGHLKELLAAPGKVRAVVPRTALAYIDVHGFVKSLREREGIAARAVELAILTACRPGEVAGMQWGEVDTERALWTVPGVRMKAGKEHTVPLSARALALLRALPRDGSDNVFSGIKSRPITTAGMLKAARSVEATVDVHGFRSTFRDWAGETTAHPREVIEHALAHRLKDKAEAAYARGSLLAKRARLMADWAAYVERAPLQATVTPIKSKVKA
ncbi:MAG: integrase arm-type DNA-binding domain-containing protein [Casimicrobiaceae bacterium]